MEFCVRNSHLSSMRNNSNTKTNKNISSCICVWCFSDSITCLCWSATDSNGDDAGANVVFSATSSATTDITYAATGTFTIKLTLTDSTYIDYTEQVSVDVVVS